VFSEYEFRFEKRLTVVRLAAVTFWTTFAEVAKMLDVVRALVKMAFPDVDRDVMDVTREVVFIEIVFIFVLNTFGAVKIPLTKAFPPIQRVAAGGVAVPRPRVLEMLKRDKVPVFRVVMFADRADIELLV